jgi:adenosylcobinamide-GDP ribazoletransferase
VTARDIIADLLSAVALLSRLPVPDHTPRTAASAWAWPLVGALLGALAAMTVSLCIAIDLPIGVTAVVGLVTLALLTGALHEDGLADTADGLFGGWTKERRLEIMKDSRVGSYGVLALILVTLARWSALTSVVAMGEHVAVLIAVGAVSRAPMVGIMFALPNARETGLSHATGRPSAMIVALAFAVAVGIAILFLQEDVLLSILLGFAVTVPLALTAYRRIGGQTGDILGASQQLAETAAMAGFVASFG